MSTEGLRLHERRADILARGAFARFSVLLATGLVSGALGVVRSGHLAGGAVPALLSAGAYAVAAAYVTGAQLRKLRGLTRRERVQVVRSVRAGTAPDDPRLARATLDHVAHLRRTGLTSGPMATLIVLAVGLLVLARTTGQPLVLAAEGGVVGAWQAMLPPLRSRRYDEQWMARNFAEREARRVLLLPPEPTPRLVIGPGRALAIGALALVTAVVVGVQAFTYVQSLPQPGPAEIDRDPVAAGYTEITTVAGTTIWLRKAPGTMKMRATGRVEEACTVDLVGDDEDAVGGFNWDNVCNDAEHRRGNVLGFVRVRPYPSTTCSSTTTRPCRTSRSPSI